MGEKSTKSPSKAAKPAKKGYLEMVKEAIKENGDRKGATVSAIKTHLIENYKVDPTMLRSRLKAAIKKGFETEVLVRPKTSEIEGPSLQGRFKLNKAKREEKSEKKDSNVKKDEKKAGKQKKATTAGDKAQKIKKGRESKGTPKKAKTAKKSPKAKSTKSPKAKKTTGVKRSASQSATRSPGKKVKKSTTTTAEKKKRKKSLAEQIAKTPAKKIAKPKNVKGSIRKPKPTTKA